MKIKYVGDCDHVVCFAGKTYVLFEKGIFVEVEESDALQIMSKHPAQFEKEEVKAKAPKVKVLPEVAPYEPKL